MIYSGIVMENGTSPVRVWLPKKDGYFGIAERYRGVGANLLNSIDEDKRCQILQACHYFYQATVLSPGGETMYDEVSGKATVQEGCRDLSQEVSLAQDPNSGDRFRVPGACERFQYDQSAPAFNLSVNYVLQTTEGQKCMSFPNHPKERLVSLSAGQRVLVTFIDDGSTGVIIGSLPWNSTFNQMLGPLS